MKLAIAVIALAACTTEPPTDDSGPAPGTEGAECYGNGTCNGPLVCVDAVCAAASAPDASTSADSWVAPAPDAVDVTDATSAGPDDSAPPSPCGPGETLCTDRLQSPACVDLTRDPSNCGACNHTCGSPTEVYPSTNSTHCSAGSCLCDHPAPGYQPCASGYPDAGWTLTSCELVNCQPGQVCYGLDCFNP